LAIPGRVCSRVCSRSSRVGSALGLRCSPGWFPRVGSALTGMVRQLEWGRQQAARRLRIGSHQSLLALFDLHQQQCSEAASNQNTPSDTALLPRHTLLLGRPRVVRTALHSKPCTTQDTPSRSHLRSVVVRPLGFPSVHANTRIGQRTAQRAELRRRHGRPSASFLAARRRRRRTDNGGSFERRIGHKAVLDR
jgi:hypothetical protein